jgi:hypothetical protein
MLCRKFRITDIVLRAVILIRIPNNWDFFGCRNSMGMLSSWKYIDFLETSKKVFSRELIDHILLFF